jgi:hypothetical protein
MEGIITGLLHGVNLKSTSTASSQLATFLESKDAVLPQRAETYATILRKSVATAILVLFFCLYIVLHFEAVPEYHIDRLMCLAISCAGKSYPSKIRKGVNWANTLIDELNRRGWGNRGSELLMLCESGCRTNMFAPARARKDAAHRAKLGLSSASRVVSDTQTWLV